jgi:hypothetical protein
LDFGSSLLTTGIEIPFDNDFELTRIIFYIQGKIDKKDGPSIHIHEILNRNILIS